MPTMTSIMFDRFSSAPASCCATHPATATTGARPVSSLALPNLAEPRVELFFRALAHAAGVDDNNVRVVRVGRRLVASLLQQPRHALGVVDVHLAAVGFNEVLHGLVSEFFDSVDSRDSSDSSTPGTLATLRLALGSALPDSDSVDPFRFRLLVSASLSPAPSSLARGGTGGVGRRRSPNHTRHFLDALGLAQTNDARLRAAVGDRLSKSGNARGRPRRFAEGA